MRRRDCLGLLAGAGLAGCLIGTEESKSEPESQNRTTEPTDSTDSTPTPTEPAGTTTPAEQEPAEGLCTGWKYFTYGEWYDGPDFSFTVLEIRGQTEISVSPSQGLDGPTSLPEERQLISVRVAVRNATNETKDLCGICNGFGLIQADYRVARCSLEYEFQHGTLYLDWVDDGFDLPLYPPDGPLEPGEIREAQTGAVIHSGYDPKEIRVGLDTSIPGYGIQWEAEGVDTEKPEC